MTIHIPRWLLGIVVLGIAIAIAGGAFLIGRSTGSDEPSRATAAAEDSADQEVSDSPSSCTERAAERATLSTEFDAEIRAYEEAVAEMEGGDQGQGSRGMYFGPTGVMVAGLTCADLTGDGADEMIFGLAAGAGGYVHRWAIFSPDGEGGWELAFFRVGLQSTGFKVQGNELVSELPIYREGDARCCPSGSKSIRVRYADGRFLQTGVAGEPVEREIILDHAQQVVSFGGLPTLSSDPSAARRLFGRPTGEAYSDGELCPLSWDHLGIRINFVNLGGRDACGPHGRIGSIDIRGTAAESAGWQTSEGIGVGSSERKVKRAYPDAELSEYGGLILASREVPYADGVAPSITIYLSRGKVRAMRLGIGAGGE